MSDEAVITVDREPVDGACAECGEERLMRYAVLSEGGWFDVVKCQNCLHSESRAPNPVGPMTLPSAVLI